MQRKLVLATDFLSQRTRDRLHPHGVTFVDENSRDGQAAGHAIGPGPVNDLQIPREVLSLLRERLSGLHEIKALLLVHGDPSRCWSPSAIAEELRWPREWGRSALENLAAAGLVVGIGSEPEQQFSYRPTTSELDSAVAALAEIHGEDGLDVIRILIFQAFDRIRSAVSTLGDVIALVKKQSDADGRKPV